MSSQTRGNNSVRGISDTIVSNDQLSFSIRLENGKKDLKTVLNFPRGTSSEPTLDEAIQVMSNIIPLIVRHIDPVNHKYTVSALRDLIMCPKYGILTSTHPAWNTNQNSGHLRTILDRVRIAMLILNLDTSEWINPRAKGKSKFVREKILYCAKGGLMKILQGKKNFIPFLARPKSVGSVIYIFYDILKDITNSEIQHFISFGSIKKLGIDWTVLKELQEYEDIPEAPSSVLVQPGEMPEASPDGNWTISEQEQRAIYLEDKKSKFVSLVWRSLIASRVCRSEHRNDYMRLRMVGLTKAGMIYPPKWINKNWISDFDRHRNISLVY